MSTANFPACLSRNPNQLDLFMAGQRRPRLHLVVDRRAGLIQAGQVSP
ncbi:MAG TPA: hypothetical protein VGF08_09590 [Terriglobales bacterium]